MAKSSDRGSVLGIDKSEQEQTEFDGFIVNPSHATDHNKNSTGIEADDDLELWTAGDVEEDFALLEQAILLSKANDDLLYQQRLEQLHIFAQQRRAIVPDIQKFVLHPLLLSWVTAIALKGFGGLSLARQLSRLSSVHFLVFSFLLPLLLLVRNKPWQRRLDLFEDSELESFGSIYTAKVYKNLDDDRTVDLTILEHWMSAVGGLALVLLCIPHNPWGDKTGFALAWARLGTLASLYQFPTLVSCHLERQGQARPIALYRWMLLKLISCQWFAFFVFFDVAVGSASTLGWVSANLLYGTITGFAVAGIGMVSSGWKYSLHARRLFQQAYLRRGLLRGISVGSVVLYLLSRHGRNLVQSMDFMIQWRQIVTEFSALTLALVGPTFQVAAISKLFRVVHTHRLPLTDHTSTLPYPYWSNSNSLRKQSNFLDALLSRGRDRVFKHLKEPCLEEGDDHKTLWRYRLSYREPIRIGPVVREWWLNLPHKVFTAIFPPDDPLSRINQLSRDDERQEMWSRRFGGLLANNSEARSRDTKADAMEQVARKHKQDYESGTYDDPLGVAVQQTLGIGLCFSSTHMDPLMPGEKPTARRLQARAAKSAIRRVGQLQKEIRLLQNIADPVERFEKVEKMTEKAEKEKLAMAQRLTDLIPTESSKSKDDSPMKFDVLSMYNKQRNENRFIRDLLDENAKRKAAGSKSSMNQTKEGESLPAQRSGPSDDSDDELRIVFA